jgi:hypothetical protein
MITLTVGGDTLHKLIHEFAQGAARVDDGRLRVTVQGIEVSMGTITLDRGGVRIRQAPPEASPLSTDAGASTDASADAGPPLRLPVEVALRRVVVEDGGLRVEVEVV